ncbi:MAG: carboxylating nicotinate-nucleotide diphosphorylase [Deltaproteobacteria bacterium]|nr:carboxylating nicotinate-nucleotide diphosphorylase [Deltaproteobacteria bacterium]MBW2136186.1 carboxylating nicotinate-nucleotide diphosphorylase [Deltaproteobacteria bacterium]
MESKEEILEIVQMALREDIGSGDVTTECTVQPGTKLRGEMFAKERGVVAGVHVAGMAFEVMDPEVRFTPRVRDGDFVGEGAIISEIFGEARSILSAERVALNLLQRMSGIASLTRRFVDAVKLTKAVIIDTRKTVPGLRILDKMAVRMGGGQNHRFGLFDMALIKENHITVAGGITRAVRLVRERDPLKRPVEVEVRTLEELKEALGLRVDRIMLDNMSIEEMREAVRMTGGRVPLEASGTVSMENVAEIAETGVDFISVGKLTHSVKALDISLILKSDGQEREGPSDPGIIS